MRANTQGNQGPEREAFKIQFGDFSNEDLAAIAQNITERLWMDEDDFKFVSNQDRNFGMMAGNALGLTDINSGQGSVGMRETCGRYPTFDGSCNHEDNGGKILKHYERIETASYCNGQSSISCFMTEKTPLPAARAISNFLEKAHRNKDATNLKRTKILTDMGQFVTHDIIQTPDLSGTGTNCRCAANCSCNDPSKCVPIPTPNDPDLKLSCFFITRSSATLETVNGKLTRQQVNQLSSTIDGTTIYGATKRHAEAVKAKNKMHLLTTDMGPKGEYLPTTDMIANQFNSLTDAFKVSEAFNNFKHPSFFAGDTRVMENGVLSMYHTMFLRIHNLVVDKILEVNPDAANEPEMVFNEARLFTIASIQHVIYSEQLPALLGEFAISTEADMQLSDKMKKLDPNRPSPRIFNEFATAAFRYGHAAQPTNQITKDEKYNNINSDRLKNLYFDPHWFILDGPGAVCRGAMTENGITPGTKWVSDTRNDFFQVNGVGVDLFSINVSRGRDHGLARYIKVRKWCQLNYPRLYDDWNGMDTHWNELVAKFYKGQQWEVDLYIGLLSELEAKGSELGPTNTCIIMHQFKQLKMGDKFWYENENFFMKQEKLDTVKSLNLAKIICLTMDGMDRVPNMPFIGDGIEFGGKVRKMVKCENLIADLDLSAGWGVESTTTVEAPTEPPTTTSTSTTTTTTTTAMKTTTTETTTTTTTEQPTTEPTTEPSMAPTTLPPTEAPTTTTMPTIQTQAPTEAPTEAPTQPVTEPQTPRPTIDNTDEPICDFDADTRRISCGGIGFDNDSLEKMHFRLRLTHAYPIDVNGQRLAVKAQAVKELDLSNSPNLTDNEMFLQVITDFPNLRELFMANTGITLSKDAIKSANGNIRLIKTKPV